MYKNKARLVAPAGGETGGPRCLAKELRYVPMIVSELWSSYLIRKMGSSYIRSTAWSPFKEKNGWSRPQQRIKSPYVHSTNRLKPTSVTPAI